MRGDFKLMLFGFFAGLAIGAFALTSVSASIEGQPKRGDRQPAADRTLSYDDLPAATRSAKTLAPGETATLVEFFDARGTLIYRSDPATATTTVARGAVIPTPSHIERDDASQRMVQAAEEPATVTTGAN